MIHEAKFSPIANYNFMWYVKVSHMYIKPPNGGENTAVGYRSCR